MSFQNYKSADYAQSTLLGSISSSATSLQVQSGEGALFPTSGDFFITLEAFTLNAQETETVTKREQVKVTARSSDTMTIVRAQNGTTAQAFDAADRVSLYLVSANLEDINTEVARLETDKLNSAGGLRTGLGATKMLTTDGSGNEAELAFPGDSSLVLKGDGTFNPSGTNINGLASDEALLTETDEIIFYNFSSSTNRKRGAKATTNREGLVEKATDVEALAKTDTTRYVTPKHLGDVAVTSFYAGVLDRSNVSGSFTMTVPHTLGVIPKFLKVVGGFYDDTGNSVYNSSGSYDGSRNVCTFQDGGTDSTSCVHIGGVFTNFVSATVTSLTDTQTVFSFTETGGLTSDFNDKVSLYVEFYA